MDVWPRSSGKQILLFAIFVVIVALAAVLRLEDLPNRTMHCDEAVHAVKFRELLEKNEYAYDPHEYHGPILNYLTLPIAWSTGASHLTEIDERHLRLLPAVFGILLVALVWLLRRDLGWVATIWAALLTAVSPAMVFYSRYYIQEMLLVCFTFAAIIAWWRFLRFVNASQWARDADRMLSNTSPKRERGTEHKDPSLARRAGVERAVPMGLARNVIRQGMCEGGALDHMTENRPRPWLRPAPYLWLAILGVSLALMHTSKETCIIAMFGLALGSCAIAGYVWRIVGWQLAVAGLIVLVTAALISPIFFSSFGANWQGVADSFTTYYRYIDRAAGEGSAGLHVHAWHYYFRILFWWHEEGGPLWTEGLIAALALVGLAAGLTGKGLGASTASPSTGTPSLLRRILQWFDGPPHIALVRMLGVYTIAVMLVYTAIPYKTPWCALGFLHGAILLAGVGAGVLVRITPELAYKGLILTVLVIPTGHLAFQAYRASFVAYEAPHNPYVYSHSTRDVIPFVEKIRDIARSHPDGVAMHVQVICPDDDFWPLPWYMRDFTQVGWHTGEPRGPDGQTIMAAPVIITQPSMRDVVINYNYFGQPPGYRFIVVELPPKTGGQAWQFRPYVPITAFVRRKLWIEYEANLSGETNE